MAQSLQEIKGQCGKEHLPTRKITYYCGQQVEETYLVCEECFKEEVWASFVKNIEVLSQ